MSISKYQKHEPILNHFDLSVNEGELLSLLGPSGCGKTTTLQMIAGLHEPSAGRIMLDGEDITLLVWDLHGEDDFQTVRTSYVRGAAGCLYVVDGTRRETLDVALELRERVEAAYPELPSMLLPSYTDFPPKDAPRQDDEGVGRARRDGAGRPAVAVAEARLQRPPLPQRRAQVALVRSRITRRGGPWGRLFICSTRSLRNGGR